MLLLFSPAVGAHAVDLRRDACHATTVSAIPAEVARLDFRCADTPADYRDKWVWLQVPPAAVAALPPRFELLVDQMRLAHLRLIVVRSDGTTEQATIDGRRVLPGQSALGGRLRLSVGPGATVAKLFIGFDRLSNFAGLRRIEARTPAAVEAVEHQWIAVMGIFVGAVGASLAGSLFFYRALRTPFQLWYGLWSLSTLMFGLFWTGLILWVDPALGGTFGVRVSIVLVTASAGLGALFFGAYVEPGVLPVRYLRLLKAVAVLGVASGVAAALDMVFPATATARIMSFVLLAQALVLILGIGIAALRSSRAVWFFAIAWAAPLTILLVRLGRGFGLSGYSDLVDMATFVALALQAVLLFVGSADRFRQLQREHQVATIEQAILRRLTAVVFQVTPQGRWTFLNPAWEEFAGVGVSATLGRSAFDFLHPDHHADVRRAFTALTAGTIIEYRAELRYRRHDGGFGWAAVRAHLRCDSDGEVIGVDGSFHDITDRRASQAALAASEARHRALSETSVAGIFQCDPRWNIVYSNPAFSRITGLSQAQARGIGWLDAIRPDQRATMGDSLADPALAGTSAPRGRTLCFVMPDGTERWATTGITAIFDREGAVSGYAGITLDITEQHAAVQKLSASEARFSALAKLSPAVIFRTDTAGNCSFVNDAWTTLTGGAPADALGTGWMNALHPDERRRIERDLAALTTKPQLAGREYRFCRPDGSIRWTTLATAHETAADGTLTGYVGVITDITAQKQLEIELTTARTAAELAATTDELTGLPNRRQFMARLHGEIATCRDRAAPLALAMIDIDHFKRINDTHGHPRGDEVLRVVGNILRANVRSIDHVGRIGGEEFAVLMPDTDRAMAQAICERIRTAIASSRLDLDPGVMARVTVSIGIAALLSGERMSELIARTDEALYLSKNAGRNRVHLAA